MKNLILTSLFLLIGTGILVAQEEKQAVEKATEEMPVFEDIAGPKMTFEETVVDYGEIDKGSEPLREFIFVNDGQEPLVIKNAKGSCGCTVPSHPQEPIMPGEQASIEVRYDTNRVGPFTKTVTLTTNMPTEKVVLTIKGKVLQVAEEDSVPEKEKSVF